MQFAVNGVNGKAFSMCRKAAFSARVRWVFANGAGSRSRGVLNIRNAVDADTAARFGLSKSGCEECVVVGRGDGFANREQMVCA